MYKVTLCKWLMDGEPVDIKTAKMENYLRNNPEFNPDIEYHHRTLVTREIALPFVPFVGLNVFGTYNDNNLISSEIIDISWAGDDQMFVCYVKNEFPYKSWNYEYDHDYFLDAATKHGWEVAQENEDK